MLHFMPCDFGAPYWAEAYPAAAATRLAAQHTPTWVPLTPRLTLAENVGRFFVSKYRERIAKVGVLAVALQLRKQGVPLEVARAILLANDTSEKGAPS